MTDSFFFYCNDSTSKMKHLKDDLISITTLQPLKNNNLVVVSSCLSVCLSRLVTALTLSCSNSIALCASISAAVCACTLIRQHILQLNSIQTNLQLLHCHNLAHFNLFTLGATVRLGVMRVTTPLFHYLYTRYTATQLYTKFPQTRERFPPFSTDN